MSDYIPLSRLDDVSVTRLDEVPVTILDDIQSSMDPNALVNRVFMMDIERRNVMYK